MKNIQQTSILKKGKYSKSKLKKKKKKKYY